MIVRDVLNPKIVYRVERYTVNPMATLVGPEDDFEDAVNGDPDSFLGDDEADDEFDEMADFPDEDESDDDEDDE